MASAAESRPDTGKGDEVVLLDLQAVVSVVGTTQSIESGDEGRTVWQNAKKYRKVVAVTFGMASAILLYGYDFVIVGTVSGMPEFQ